MFSKDFLTSVDILGGLTDISVDNPSRKEPRNIPTKRRTPIPADITFAGEKICENNQGQIEDELIV